MGKASNFLGIVRLELQRRFDMLYEHGFEYLQAHSDSISQRMLWYNSVSKYKKEFGTDELDISGDASKQYNTMLKSIRAFCEKKSIVSKAIEIDSKNSYWGILRKSLNIESKGRAIAYGCVGDDIMIVPQNREKYVDSGLLIAICEKETLGKKWLAAMNKRGWEEKIVLIITQGFSACEVVETIMEIRDNIEDGKTNIVIGVIHDLDIAGIGIYQDIKQWFDETLDFGINFDMLDSINPSLWDTIKEKTRVNAEQMKYMKNIGLAMTLAQLGEYRLELDNLYVNVGIEPFCDYTEKVIDENISIWDINRIKKPYVMKPKKYRYMRDQLEGLWEKIVLAATGEDSIDINFNKCVMKPYSKMLKINRAFTGDIAAIKDYETYIYNQSKELQKIIETNESNIEKVAKIQEIYNKLNVESLIDLISQDEDDENDEEDT